MVSRLEVLFGAALAVAALLLDGVARADGGDGSTEDERRSLAEREAQALRRFREGRELMVSGHYAEACSKFAESQTLDPGAGTMLNLAYGYEKLGRTASAWAEYREAAVAAHEKGKLEWEDAARERAAQLEGSLLRVVIRVKDQAGGDGVNVLVDGTPLPRSVWGEPAPIGPGWHEVRASARQGRTWTGAFEVEAGHVPTVTIPVLEESSKVNREGERAPVRSVAPGADRDLERPPSTLTTGALAMAGAGVAALGMASALALTAKSTYDGADCQGTRCTREGIAEQSRAYTELGVAATAATVGGASLLGAAILWLAPSAGRAAIQIQPELGRTAWGVSLQGDW
jgi:hypothetical protein